MAGEISTLSDFFGNLENHIVEKHLKGVTAVYQFKISGDGGGDWHVDVKDNAFTCTSGVHDSPSVTYEVAADLYLKIINGKANGRMAVLKRKMKVTGSIPAAMKMQKFLPPRKG
ncbi:MAG: putative sterol carrier protein [Myxococcota bacterium]|jgi:putative sterol carrier protein